MTPLLTRYWSTNANLPIGEKLDLSERLLGFYAQHLRAHEDWRIQPRQDLVNSSRQTLLAVIGVKNSEDTIYQGVLDRVGNRYPDQTLASLTAGTDTRCCARHRPYRASSPGKPTRAPSPQPSTKPRSATKRRATGCWPTIRNARSRDNRPMT
jgi:type VI protein secretion system component VasK